MVWSKTSCQKIRSRFLEKNTIQAIHDFYCGIGIQMTLPEVGIDDSRLAEMAQHVADNEGLENVWAPLLGKEVLEIYKACME